MAPLLGTMEDVLRKALDRASFSIGGPFMSEGKPGIRIGGLYTSLNDE